MTVEYKAVEAKNNEVMSVTLESGSILDANTVRNYLVSGNGRVTDQEVVMFLQLCKSQKLNPFVKDAYLIKYGENQPAQIIVGKDVFIKRAYENPNFDGMKAGIVVQKNDGIEYREGSLKLPREVLVGGWCEVYLKDKKFPAKAVVSFEEYAQRKKDGNLNTMWATKGATMIRKVAQSQAMREAFPTEFRGCYQKEEMGAEYDAPVNEIPAEVIERKETVVEFPAKEKVEVIEAEIVEDENTLINNDKKRELLKIAEENGLYDKKTKKIEKLEEYLMFNNYILSQIKNKEYEDVLKTIKEYGTTDEDVENLTGPQKIIKNAQNE